MFPLFTNAALLAGLAGITAPILIHLLLRRKSQRLRFSTIQFFVRKDEQSMRKRKLRNLLLLAARVILFALIVLAFTRPYLPIGGAAAARSPRQQVVLLLDSSASMQATGPNGQQWARAKDLARKALGSLQADDRAALVSSSAQSVTVSEFAPPSVVAQKLADLKVTSGSGELSDGLQHVLKLLAHGNPAYPTTLYIVSDLQRSGCPNLAATPLPGSVTLKVLDLGERFIPNISVTDLQLDRQNQTEPHAVVTSFSDENYSGLKVAFKVDAKEMFSRELHLADGASTNLPLSLPALAPGWHSAEVKVESKDGLAADDARYSTIWIPEPIHGSVVETRKAPKIFQEESYFIAAALDPSHGTNQESLSRFAYDKIDLENLPQKLQAQAGQPKIEFVVLPGVKQLSTALATALNSYVQAGGGLLLFLGGDLSANAYNTLLHDLLPAQLAGIEAAGESEAAWRIGEFNKASPIFSVFAEPNSGNLLLPEFRRRFALTANSGSSILAEFDDGSPLVVQRNIGKGKVVLVNTSADTGWTDWQKHKTFVPWLHATTRFLGNRDPGMEQAATATFVSGSEVDFELGLKKQTLSLQRAGGPELKIATDDAGRLRDVPLDAPGLYTLKDAGGHELRRIAVNLPLAESSLSSLTPADFQQQIVRAAEPLHPTLSASLFGDPARGKELWRMLLLAALALMLIEPFVANKTVA